jgi:hypothetical protein
MKQALPAGEDISSLAGNPQALVSSQALSDLRTAVSQSGPAGQDLAEQLVLTLRETLASAIGDVFVIGLVAVGLGFAATVFLKELPLAKRRESPRGVGAPDPSD